MDKPHVRNARPSEAQAIFNLSRKVYEGEQLLVPASAIKQHIQAFPEGVFVAEIEGRIVAYAITLRTHRSPDEKPLAWIDAIGGYELAAHAANGHWLYGVDFGVHPLFRKRGIGSLVYRARFEMVKRLNLVGFYAGGMLAGFHEYPHLSLEEYAGQVRDGRLKDPTITMQMNRGFKVGQAIKHYAGLSLRHHSAMLIKWLNPNYRLRLRQSPAAIAIPA